MQQYFPLKTLHRPRALGDFGWSLWAPFWGGWPSPALALLLFPGSVGPSGSRGPGSAPGLRGAWSSEPGNMTRTQTPWPCAQAASSTAWELDIQKSAVGKEDSGMVLGVQLRVASLLFRAFSTTEEDTTEEVCGLQICGWGMRVSAFTGAMSRPPCPFQTVGSQEMQSSAPPQWGWISD